MSNRNLFAAVLVAFLLVTGIGAGTSYFKNPPREAISQDARSKSNSEMFARLKDYARSVETQSPAPPAAAAAPLPDVNTMIDKLADRLKTAPEDIKGWRMLGWSYFNTGRFEQAAAAYAKAVALDPSSAELKTSYEEAKVKASGATLHSPAKSAGNGGDDLHVTPNIKPEGPPPHDAIRSMVDGLASRLEGSPRDVDGWTRLMRSRVVLGEQQTAASALRKALEVFKDDHAATGRLTAAAAELGLKAE